MSTLNPAKKLENAFNIWLESLAADGATKATINGYKSKVGTFVKWFGESSYATEDPTPATILAFKIACRENGKSSETTRQYLRVLHIMFKFWEEPGMQYHYTNPVTKDIIPKHKDKSDPYAEILNSSDLLKIIAKPCVKARGNAGSRNRAIVILLLSTGIRREELTRLKLRSVNFDKKQLLVYGKGRKYRIVPLPEIAESALRDYFDSGFFPKGMFKNAPIFGSVQHKRAGDSGHWKALSTAQIYSVVKSYILAKTGKEVSPHALRHVYSRLLLQNGASLEEIQSALGHSDLKTTQIYTGRLLKSTEDSTAFKVFANLAPASR